MKRAPKTSAKPLPGILLSLSLLTAASGCFDTARAAPPGGVNAPAEAPVTSAAAVGLAPAPTPAPVAPPDAEGERCRARAAGIEATQEAPGAPEFEANRIEILGRARGEPLLLVREPAATPDAELTKLELASKRSFERGRRGSRVYEAVKRHKYDPKALRAVLLREGYAFSSDPHDALAIVTAVHMADLFSEPEIWIQRGADTRKLVREEKKREVAYRYVDGPSKGRAADLLFGDRVALSEEDLKSPIHRDLRGLADSVGFDRAKITRRTEGALLASLRFGETWVKAVIEAEGAALRLDCIDEEKAKRDEVARELKASAPRRQALAKIHEVVTAQVTAALRFDRPEGEKTADRDGHLRPVWATAYFQGRTAFTFEESTFPVFDSSGAPWPPQVCVDFVLDTFERASGTWYSPQGEAPKRMRGKIDFDEVGIKNRRGVMAFGKFAEEQPSLFQVKKFVGDERIPFGERSRYFQFLVDNADDVRMGDVVAIHGLKADDRIHQHAIFVEWTDPLTGFAYGLADQMKKPRRRTWEGIMAEAPKRSLYYRVRPTDELFARIGGGEGGGEGEGKQ
jgi:hypothetical protein